MRCGLLAAFLAGSAAMALEMTASRWLAPGFGTTLETWSWLIGSALLAGACGAALGASLLARITPIAPLLVASGAILIAAVTHRALVEALLVLPLQLGAACAALLLVGPASLALGAVLPLLAERGAAHGARGLGALLAASTAGSLTGTLLPAIGLIPWVGTRATALLFAALLAAAAASLMRPYGIGTAVILALAGFVQLFATRSEGSPSSPYAELELRTERDALRLYVDGIAQGSYAPLAASGACSLARGQWIALLPYLHPRGRRALQIGLGLGESARVLEESAIEVESVELDPVVAELARTRGFARGAIHVGDGRTFWRRSRSRYDFVVLDAFQGESLPEHLLSAEALRELRERLHPGGILVLHVIAHAEGTAAAALWRTLGAAFEERLALRTPRSDSLQDLFFFASEKPLAPPPHPELAATPLAEARYEPPSHGVLLHDDRNPLGLLHRHEARVLRLASMRDARRSTSSAPAGGSSAR